MKHRKHRLLLAPLLLFWPVQSTAQPSQIVSTTPTMKLDVFTLVPTYQSPDYTKDVLKPLYTVQAQEAAQLAANIQACSVQGGNYERGECILPPPPPSPPPQTVEAPQSAPEQPTMTSGTPAGGAWAELRNCEAGGNYAENTGNGFYGAYQFDIQTWGNYGGYSRPDLAPSSVQDAKAQEVQAARGWSPWPACASKLGLS